MQEFKSFVIEYGKMKFNDPLSHKCPKCSSDLYTQHRQNLFEFILTGTKFKCKNCNTNLRWKKNLSLILLRLGFILLVISSVAIPVSSGLTGLFSIYTLFIIAIASISSVTFLVNMLFLEIES